VGTDLLSDIRREIEQRLIELRPAVQEYEQLLHAAEAIELDLDNAAEARPTARRTPTKRTPGRRTHAGGGGASAAAAAARDAVLGALEHGSHTVAELVVVTAMSTSAINGSLRKLAGQGVVAKTDREGKIAWSLTRAD